jgi:hypothetical protein
LQIIIPALEASVGGLQSEAATGKMGDPPQKIALKSLESDSNVRGLAKKVQIPVFKAHDYQKK